MTSPGVGLMAQSEVINFIKENATGVLSLVDGDKPYAIPLEHSFDGTNLYFRISPREGRKVSCIKQNPNACYLIYKYRREDPKAFPCRSILFEGQLSLDGTTLKMAISNISNWKCPPAMLASCKID